MTTINRGHGMWFYPNSLSDRLPAVVDKVFSPTMVNLMVDEGPSMVTPRSSVPVWDGISRGTKDIIGKALRAELPVSIYEPK